jgi:hypothetical protein
VAEVERGLAEFVRPVPKVAIVAVTPAPDTAAGTPQMEPELTAADKQGSGQDGAEDLPMPQVLRDCTEFAHHFQATCQLVIHPWPCRLAGRQHWPQSRRVQGHWPQSRSMRAPAK